MTKIMRSFKIKTMLLFLFFATMTMNTACKAKVPFKYTKRQEREIIRQLESDRIYERKGGKQ